MSAALRSQAIAIFSQGLERIRPDRLLRKALSLTDDKLQFAFPEGSRSLDLSPSGRIIMLAVGKAAAPMASEVHRLLGGRISAGLVVTKRGFSLPGLPDLPGLPFPVRETGHPVPDESGIAAAHEAEALLQGLEPHDVLLALISGGASALLPAPLPGISLEEKQRLAELMLSAGMDIHRINLVRKAISRLKGGGLAVRLRAILAKK